MNGPNGVPDLGGTFAFGIPVGTAADYAGLTPIGGILGGASAASGIGHGLGIASGTDSLSIAGVQGHIVLAQNSRATHSSNGVGYNDEGKPVGELGLQPEPPIPDVTMGVDSPIGGVQTTLPFGSGGAPTTVRRGPSYNLPLPGDYNLKLFPQTGPGA